MKIFSTKFKCEKYIIENDLEAIPMPYYDEEGMLWYWCIYYI